VIVVFGSERLAKSETEQLAADEGAAWNMSAATAGAAKNGAPRFLFRCRVIG
jgi:hypothetical protein